MEEGLQVGVVLGDEELVVDVAEIVEGLVAGETVLLFFLVDLLADPALPLRVLLLLVLHSAGSFGAGLAAGLVVVPSYHRVLYFKFKYRPSMYRFSNQSPNKHSINKL